MPITLCTLTRTNTFKMFFVDRVTFVNMSQTTIQSKDISHDGTNRQIIMPTFNEMAN